MTSFTIPNNSYFVKSALKLTEGLPDILYGHLLEPGALCLQSEMKTHKTQMTPYAIPNNSYLVNNALKGAEGPPDLH